MRLHKTATLRCGKRQHLGAFQIQFDSFVLDNWFSHGFNAVPDFRRGRFDFTWRRNEAVRHLTGLDGVSVRYVMAKISVISSRSRGEICKCDKLWLLLKTENVAWVTHIKCGLRRPSRKRRRSFLWWPGPLSPWRVTVVQEWMST